MKNTITTLRNWIYCIFCILFLLSVSLSSCAPPVKDIQTLSTAPTTLISTTTDDGISFPADEWGRDDPERHGMDSTVLDSICDYMDSNADKGVKSMVIIRDGVIVFEKYVEHTNRFLTHEDYSVTKSFVSALIGIAIDDGYIGSADDKVLDYLKDWDIEDIDTVKESITIGNALSMQSGIKWDDGNSMATLDNDNPVLKLLSSPMESQPGTDWNYNTVQSSVLTTIIQRVTGTTAFKYAQEKLFKPIGITSAKWRKDFEGVNYGGTRLSMTTEDLARFGYLFLNNGMWGDKKIISEEWVKASTTTKVSLAENGSEGAQLFKDAGSYAYHWWTLTGNAEAESAGFKEGDLYRAAGYAGQYIYVCPKYNLVVAMNNYLDSELLEGGDYGNMMFFDYVLKAIDY